MTLLEKKIERVIIYNVNPPFQNEKTIFSGWVLIEKVGKDSTKTSFMSLDTSIIGKFIFPEKYLIKVDWKTIEPSEDSVVLLHKVIFGDIDADIFGSEIRQRNDRELELIQNRYKSYKVILMNSHVGKIHTRVQ